MQHGAQVSHGPVHLHAEHQDDQQHVEFHITTGDPICPDAERGCGTHCNGAIGNPTPQGVGGENPHRRAEQLAGADGQGIGSRLALAKRLQRRQPLDRIEQFGGKGSIGMSTFE